MTLMLWSGIAFFLGSIPFGLLISKYWLGLDIRQHGSGNIGMTNVMRVGGKWPGILTFILDFLKGAFAVAVARHFLSAEVPAERLSLVLALIAVIAVCGHVFSIFLRFQGGKGISTTFGVLAVLNFPLGVVAAGIWVGVFLAKKISSLAALSMLLSVPVLFLIMPRLQGQPISWEQFGLFTMLSVLLLYKHRENIGRLLRGEEGKLQAKS